MVIVFKLSSDTGCVLIYNSNNEEFYLPWMIQLKLHVIQIETVTELAILPSSNLSALVFMASYDLFIYPTIHLIIFFSQLWVRLLLLFYFLNFGRGYCFEHLDICTYDVEYSLFDYWVNDD